MKVIFVLAAICAAAYAEHTCGCPPPPPVNIQLSCGPQQPPPPPPPPQQECVAPPPQPPTTVAPEPAVVGTEAEPEPVTEVVSTPEPPADQPVPCAKDNNLALVIDSSTSWGENTYKTALEFAARFGSAWRENPGNGVAVVTYATVAEAPLKFDESFILGPKQIHDRILAINWLKGSIRVDLGLDVARQEFINQAAIGEDNPKNIVIFTDGVTTDWPLLQVALTKVQNEGIRTFVVALGGLASSKQKELLQIAQGNQDHIFTVQNAGTDLLNILRDISKKVCDAPNEHVPVPVIG